MHEVPLLGIRGRTLPSSASQLGRHLPLRGLCHLSPRWPPLMGRLRGRPSAAVPRRRLRGLMVILWLRCNAPIAHVPRWILGILPPIQCPVLALVAPRSHGPRQPFPRGFLLPARRSPSPSSAAARGAPRAPWHLGRMCNQLGKWATVS